MATGFADNCTVAVGNTYNTVGTLTRASLNTLTPTQVRAVFGPDGKWGEMNALLKHSIEMQACGIRRSALYDWIMSSNKPGMGNLIKIERIAKGPSRIQPFILGLQKSFINDDVWYITANVADNSYAGGALPGATAGGTRVISVKPSWDSNMDLSAQYFPPGKNIHVVSRGGGSAFTLTQFRVIQAGVNAGNSTVDIEVALNQVTGGTHLPSDANATSGLVFIGINNVHDVEAWCHNMPNHNVNKLVPFWYQTYRRVRSVDSEYKLLFKDLMENNEWYAKFQDIPLAERNRQDELRERKEWLHAFFFGEALNSNQTLSNWGSLPQIVSASGSALLPGTSGQLMAYRANMIGVVPQLQACGRFDDAAGTPINIDQFLEQDIYEIWRARESTGKAAREIDVYTDQDTAAQFEIAFIKYMKEKLSDTVRINIEYGEHPLGFPYRKYRLWKPHGVILNIITDNYFDDLVSAFGASPGPNAADLGRFLMVLDLGQGGTVYPAILGSNRKQYTTGEIENLAKVDATFSCVMENPTIDRTLTSVTCTAIVECARSNLIKANFSGIQYLSNQP